MLNDLVLAFGNQEVRARESIILGALVRSVWKEEQIAGRQKQLRVTGVGSQLRFLAIPIQSAVAGPQDLIALRTEEICRIFRTDRTVYGGCADDLAVDETNELWIEKGFLVALDQYGSGQRHREVLERVRFSH